MEAAVKPTKTHWQELTAWKSKTKTNNDRPPWTSPLKLITCRRNKISFLPRWLPLETENNRKPHKMVHPKRKKKYLKLDRQFHKRQLDERQDLDCLFLERNKLSKLILLLRSKSSKLYKVWILCHQSPLKLLYQTCLRNLPNHNIKNKVKPQKTSRFLRRITRTKDDNMKMLQIVHFNLAMRMTNI